MKEENNNIEMHACDFCGAIVSQPYEPRRRYISNPQHMGTPVTICNVCVATCVELFADPENWRPAKEPTAAPPIEP